MAAQKECRRTSYDPDLMSLVERDPKRHKSLLKCCDVSVEHSSYCYCYLHNRNEATDDAFPVAKGVREITHRRKGTY